MSAKTLDDLVYACDDKLEHGMAGKYVIYVKDNTIRLRVCPITDWQRFLDSFLPEETFDERFQKSLQDQTQRTHIKIDESSDPKMRVIRHWVYRDSAGYKSGKHRDALEKQGMEKVEAQQVIGGGVYVIIENQFYSPHYGTSQEFNTCALWSEITDRCLQSIGLREGHKKYKENLTLKMIKDAQTSLQTTTRH